MRGQIWRRITGLPRIDSEKAAHQWKPSHRDDPSAFLGARATWFCIGCEKQLDMRGVEPPAVGCGRPRFTGRYKPGDHADHDNMRYVFDRYSTEHRAMLHQLGRPSETLICDVADLAPVLSGRAEAEKRRLAYLDRIDPLEQGVTR